MLVADEFQIWPFIADEIIKRLPLKDVLWTPPTLKSAQGSKKLAVLDIELKRFSADMFPKTTVLFSNVSPYFLNLYFVNCEDLDIYKNFVRKQITDWLNVVGAKKNQEWLIVHVSSQDTKNKALRFLTGAQTSVFEKLKTDFNFKQDRCVQLKINSQEAKDQDTWTELMNRIRDMLLLSYNNQLQQFDDDARKLDAQRLLPGWNYGQYFLVKESIAIAHDYMGQCDEALLIYDELEAHFFQTLHEQGAPWFPSFGGTGPDDDSEDVLNTKRKAYRDMIVNSTITIFDFRIYLFSRQINLLFRLNMPDEICKRSKLFILSFAKTLHEYDVSLSPLFCESWVFSSCLHVIRHIEEMVAVSTQTMNELYQGFKGDLLYCARMQLDIVGVATKLLPASTYASTGFFKLRKSKIPAGLLKEEEEQEMDGNALISKISNSELRTALSSKDNFDALYLHLSDRAMKSFVSAKREKLCRILHHDLGMLFLHRGQYAASLDELKQIVFTYGAENWHIIDHEIMKMMAFCYDKLQQWQSLVELQLKLLSFPSFSDLETQLEITSQLLSNLKKLETGLRRPALPLLSIEIGLLKNMAADVHGIALEVTIHSIFSADIPIDKVTVSLFNGEDERIELSTQSSLSLIKGYQAMTLWGDAGYPGLYYPEKAVFQLGPIELTHIFEKPFAYQNLRVSDHSTFLQLDLGFPEISNGVLPSTLKIRICNRQYNIDNATMTLSSMTGLNIRLPKLISFKVIDSAHADPVQKEMTLPVVNQCISLPNTTAHSRIEFHVPFTVSAEAKLVAEHKIKSKISFHTQSMQQLFISTELLHLKLALHVTHVLRQISAHECLIQYSVTHQGDDGPIRLTDTRSLMAGERMQTLSSHQDSILFPSQTKHFLFKFNTSLINENSFMIGYSSLKTELKEKILVLLEKEIQEKQLLLYSSFLSKLFIEKVLLKLNVNHLFLVNSFPSLADVISLDFLELALQNEDADKKETLIRFVSSFLETLAAFDVASVENAASLSPFQHQFSYSHAIDHPKLFLNASCQIPDFLDSFLIGQVVPYDIHISANGLESDPFYFWIDIDFNPEFWLLSGIFQKQTFLSKQNETASVKGKLIPLKSGLLPYPKIIIKPHEKCSSIRFAFHDKTQCKCVNVIPNTTSWKYFIGEE